MTGGSRRHEGLLDVGERGKPKRIRRLTRAGHGQGASEVRLSGVDLKRREPSDVGSPRDRVARVDVAKLDSWMDGARGFELLDQLNLHIPLCHRKTLPFIVGDLNHED